MSSAYERRRALYAIHRVEALADTEAGAAYLRIAKSFGVRIRETGLGQALAFAAANDDEGVRRFVGDVGRWLQDFLGRKLSDDRAARSQAGQGVETLEPVALNDLLTLDERRYLLVQQEALEVVAWLKRMAVVTLEQRDGR